MVVEIYSKTKNSFQQVNILVDDNIMGIGLLTLMQRVEDLEERLKKPGHETWNGMSTDPMDDERSRLEYELRKEFKTTAADRARMEGREDPNLSKATLVKKKQRWFSCM
jgi:hypothetical protein